MPPKAKKVIEKQPVEDDSSESTQSSSESIFQDEVVVPVPAPVAQLSQPKASSSLQEVTPAKTHPSGRPKKDRTRKTANDEELKELKRANYAKAIEASVIARERKAEEARLKAEQEQKEKDELVRQAKEQAMKEVYERILLEQKQALKTELNKKMKTAPKKVAKATKKKEVMEEIMAEPEVIDEPVKKTIEKPKPVAKVAPAPATNVIQYTPTKTVKLTQGQMLSRFGF